MARALLLNASFEPLCVVSSRRAVVLVLKEKAEIVHRNGAEFRSERRSVPVPTVIRLVHFVRVPFRRPHPLSRGRCSPATGTAASTAGSAAENLDHVVPRSRGGPHTWENVVASCRSCNARKEDRLPAECGMVLRRQPVAPHATTVADRVGRAGRPALAAVPRSGRGRLGLSDRVLAGRSFVLAGGSPRRSRSTASSSRARWRSRARLLADLRRLALGRLALLGRFASPRPGVGAPVLFGLFDDLHRIALRRLASFAASRCAASRCAVASRRAASRCDAASRSAAARSASAASAAWVRRSDAQSSAPSRCVSAYFSAARVGALPSSRRAPRMSSASMPAYSARSVRSMRSAARSIRLRCLASRRSSLRHLLEQIGDSIGAAVSSRDDLGRDVGGAVAQLAGVFLGDVADALGGRERVAADRLGLAHRLAAKLVGVGAGPRDDRVGLEARLFGRDRGLGPGQLELELLGVGGHRVERALGALELLGQLSARAMRGRGRDCACRRARRRARRRRLRGARSGRGLFQAAARVVAVRRELDDRVSSASTLRSSLVEVRPGRPRGRRPLRRTPPRARRSRSLASSRWASGVVAVLGVLRDLGGDRGLEASGLGPGLYELGERLLAIAARVASTASSRAISSRARSSWAIASSRSVALGIDRVARAVRRGRGPRPSSTASAPCSVSWAATSASIRAVSASACSSATPSRRAGGRVRRGPGGRRRVRRCGGRAWCGPRRARRCGPRARHRAASRVAIASFAGIERGAASCAAGVEVARALGRVRRRRRRAGGRSRRARRPTPSSLVDGRVAFVECPSSALRASSRSATAATARSGAALRRARLRSASAWAASRFELRASSPASVLASAAVICASWSAERSSSSPARARPAPARALIVVALRGGSARPSPRAR